MAMTEASLTLENQNTNVPTKRKRSKVISMKAAGPIVRRAIFDGFVFAYLVMVALVAINSPGEDEYLQLGRNFTLFMGLMAAGGIWSFVLNQSGVRTLGEILFAPAHKRVPTGQPKTWYKTFWGMQTLLLVLVTMSVGLNVTEVSLYRLLDEDSLYPAMRLLRTLLSPDWAILPAAVMKMIETLYIAFVATALAVPVAFVLSFVAAKNIMGGSSRTLAIYTNLRALFNVSRSIEPIIWAIIFSIWVGFGPFAGMLALMINSVASLAKQYSEFVESVDDGPIEGIRSTGAGHVQTVWFAIVPQVILPYISYTIYRWDTNVRMATIIGFVGGGGIGRMLIEYQLQAQWPQVGCIIFVIAFVVWVMDAFSAYVREAIK